eukprot:11693052-Prorocentrum_lima.AAC.1
MRSLSLARHQVWVGAHAQHPGHDKFRGSKSHGICSAIIYRYDRESMLEERTVAKRELVDFSLKRRMQIQK